jgi:inorganic pyrophosphatase
MVNYAQLPMGSRAPETVTGVIEIPGGTRNKIQYDESLGVFRLDRTLYSPVEYPFEYGFIPSTLAGDGDPLDLLVLTAAPTFPGCIVEVRPVAKLGFRDEEGEDAKILSVPVGDPRFRSIHDTRSVLPHTLREIEEFFRTYSRLEKKKKILKGWSSRTAAHREIRAAHRRFLESGNRGASA